jgi:hypothetical protein
VQEGDGDDQKFRSGLMASGTSSVAADFPVGENGGLVRTGDAEKSDAEGEAPPSASLGWSWPVEENQDLALPGTPLGGALVGIFSSFF